MSKRRWRFTQCEVRRLIKAVTSIGLTPRGVEVGVDGNIIVLVAAEPETPSFGSPSVQPNEWENI